MKSRLNLVAALFLGVVAAGCGGRGTESVLDSDANGYSCRACDTRVYTERDLFAEKCPACGKTDLWTINAFVCPKDQAVVLAPRTDASPKCTKCGELISAVRMPLEKDLRAWGAVRKERLEVLLR